MQIIGIDKDGNTIHMAILEKKKGVVHVETYNDFSETGNRQDVNPLYKSKKKNSLTTTALPQRDLLIKHCFINIKQPRALKKAIPFQSDSIISMDPKSRVTLPLIHHKTDKGSQLSFFITTKAALKKHLHLVAADDIDPDIVSTIPTALVRFAKSLSEETSSCFIFHFGRSFCSCVLMEKNLPKEAYSINFGSETLLDALTLDSENSSTKDLLSKARNMSLSELSSKNTPNFSKIVEQLQNEISKIFLSFFKNEEKKKLPLLLTGQIETFSDFSFWIHSLLHEKVSALIPYLKHEKEKELKQYAISIGLALDALASDQYSIQFRTNEFTPPRLLLIARQKFIFFLTFSCLLSFGLYFFAERTFQNRKEKLHNQLTKLLTLENSRLKTDFNLNEQDLSEKIETFETIIDKEAKDFPYYLLAPKVSDVLNWLKDLPFYEEAKPTLEIKSLRYELVSLPRLEATHNPYLAKVEVEFLSPSRAIARQFHEYLLKGDLLVNPKEEITWEASENSYKTSFFLKNRSPSQTYVQKNDATSR